ncbi:MAG: polymer-forming cytoskeletal protein [Acidovorax sp.]|uniref:bactofilin family protein n=1 Tax=Acidovorax sp. TaxID=1872122 RepID=UPI00262A223D|nr:polymer-forming cytoskeletal protein [Acidovorax sp.]MDH4463452.1 polymer-forming cytoskeletal protein [Acidovorax sp.]
MALHFGKRENEINKPLNSSPGTPRYGAPAGAVASPHPAATAEPTPTAATGGSAQLATSHVVPEGGSKLTVGPNIKLKGVEITDCDTLFVEGLVEATMDSRVIQIAEQGAFKGTAEIDIAEIHGNFDGNLTVRQKLVIYATGRVTGKIRYGKVVIEEGGQLSGDIECTVATSAARPAASKPAMALAA